MITPENNIQKTNDHPMKLIGFIALICFVLFAFWKLGNIWIERVVNTQQEQVNVTIIKTINEQAEKKLLLPEIVFINLDTVGKKILTESIKNEIAILLTKKYLTNEKFNSNDISFQPFFIFPESSDSLGDFKLTKAQLDDLKNHIIFLTNQVDRAVSQTKEEINKEINRINTWVSIWIGLLSIFGAIVPFYYNYKNNEDLKIIKNDANKANNKVNKIEKLISIINDLNKIKNINSSVLSMYGKPIETLKILLKDIYDNLFKNSDLFNEPMLYDILLQIDLSMRLLSKSGIIKSRTNFIYLDQFVKDFSCCISQPVLSSESYIEAIGLLKNLNTNLQTE